MESTLGDELMVSPFDAHRQWINGRCCALQQNEMGMKQH